MDEITLINECVKGNAKAQYMLFEKFSKKMMAVCNRYSKNQDESEDVLQDGFVKVFTKLKDFNHSGSLEGWIRRIMVNTALDHIRKNSKFMQDIQLDSIDYQVGGNDYVLEGMMAEDLLKLINAMPDGYKVVFNMFAIEGYSHQEIADTLGISESTSKSQYMRAKAYLRSKLEITGDGR
ncbi:MAG: sigma-70 family RNA polymerase sigma factor [Flavobacteriia bacterium]|nr:sigma-70 family RNA polymerase sigma factor [Flavobacteriia bacterium]